MLTMLIWERMNISLDCQCVELRPAGLLQPAFFVFMQEC